jgi:ribosomal protein S18 acetylase RimI-like enzyme
MRAPDLSHRRAGPADHELLLRLIADYYRFDHIRFDPATAAPALASLLADDRHGRAYLLELGGEVAGYVLFTYGFDVEFGGRLATVTDLYLEPRFRRHGLGERTLTFVAGECQALGLKAIELQVEEHNLPAQALYRKAGFERLTRHPMSKPL